jgi:hypothetical protein
VLELLVHPGGVLLRLLLSLEVLQRLTALMGQVRLLRWLLGERGKQAETEVTKESPHPESRLKHPQVRKRCLRRISVSDQSLTLQRQPSKSVVIWHEH